VKTAKTFAVVIAESIHIFVIHYTTTPPTWEVVDFRKMRKMMEETVHFFPFPRVRR
jgi:hypothetical protein